MGTDLMQSEKKKQENNIVRGEKDVQETLASTLAWH
jgi:hypothetical protein